MAELKGVLLSGLLLTVSFSGAETSTDNKTILTTFYSCYFGKYFNSDPDALTTSLLNLVGAKVEASLDAGEKVGPSTASPGLGPLPPLPVLDLPPLPQPLPLVQP